jgi:hypothetical protein
MALNMRKFEKKMRKLSLRLSRTEAAIAALLEWYRAETSQEKAVKSDKYDVAEALAEDKIPEE